MSDKMEQHFIDDYHCSEAVANEGSTPDEMIVTGCGATETYQCSTSSSLWGSERICVRQNEPAAPRALPPRPRARSAVQVEDQGGHKVLLVELELEHALLRLTATPDEHAELMQLKLIRHESYRESNACNLDLMLDEQVMKTPPSVSAQNGAAVSYRVRYGPELIDALSAARSISLRACSTRWTLSPRGVQGVHDFIDRLHEEAAWKAKK